ncbi:MAG: TonB-dependent receptor [Paludibacter sp.]
MNRILIGVSSVALTWAAAPEVAAQTETAQLVESFDALEEVIITAESRPNDLQKTSQSIAVYGGDQLAKEGKRRVDEILAGVTGVTMQPDAGGDVVVFMRGAGNLNGVSSTVTLLVDGVAGNGTSVRGATLDVSQVEVMRGSQSTTMNAGALTGAVSLVTNKPVFDFQANGSIEVGNYAMRNGEAVVNVPLSDNQAIRIAYNSSERDGYYANNAGSSDQEVARLKYRWAVSDALDIVATGTSTHIGGNGASAGALLYTGHWVANDGSPIAGVQPNTRALSTPVPQNLLYPTAVNAANSTTLTGTQYSYAPLCVSNSTYFSTLPTAATATQIAIKGNGCPATYVAVRDGINWYDRDNPWDDGLPKNAFPNNPIRDSKATAAQLDINWTTDYGKLTFTPSYVVTRSLTREAINTTGGWMGSKNKTKSTTVNLNWSSDNDSKLSWTSGLYYSNTGGAQGWTQDVISPTSGWTAGMAGATNATGTSAANTVSATACYSILPGATPSARGTVNDFCYSTSPNYGTLTTNYAALANAEFALLDSLRFSAGIRKDWNITTSRSTPDYQTDRDGSNPYLWTFPATTYATPTTNPNSLFVVPQKMYLSQADLALWTSQLRRTNKSDRFNYSVGVEYDLLPDVMSYVRYQTASRAGAVDTRTGGLVADSSLVVLPDARLPNGQPYTITVTRPGVNKSLVVNTLTLGLKSRWFDNKLQVNVEAFDNVYHNRRLSEMISSLYSLTDTTSTLTCSTSANNPISVQLGTSLVDSCFNANINGYTGDMTSRGIDLEVTWLPTSADRLDLAVEYLRTVFSEVPDIGTLSADTVLSLSNSDQSKRALAQQIADNYNNFLTGATGKTLQNAPRWSANLTYQHQFKLAGGSTLIPRVIAYYKSEYWTRGGSAAGTPGVTSNPLQESDWAMSNGKDYPLVQKGYTMYDFYTSWRSANGKYTVNAFVKNLQNKAIMQNSSGVGGIVTGSIATNDLVMYPTGGTVTLAPPRTYAMSVQASF